MAAVPSCKTQVPSAAGQPEAAAWQEARERLARRFGAQLEEWWPRVPALVAGLCERWQLDLGAPVGTGNTSLVLRCRRANGRPAILKVTPDAAIAATEAFALRGWAPSGRVPAVWDADPDAGALLLEAIAIHAPLPDQAAGVTIEQIAGLIRDLHGSGAPVTGPGVGPLADRVDVIFGLWAGRRARSEAMSRAVPAGRLERGHELARSLAATPAAPPVLLHGDLHPGNVLDGGPARGLVAIDPRPSVGEPAADVVDWVFWRADGVSAWETRNQELATALGLDPARLWTWCTAFAAMFAASCAARGDLAPVQDLLAIAP